jgi:lipopolysaccharide/colanic/teichoic acid biosynthesis glycosyltransferase
MVISPLFLALMVAVWAKLGTPIFFMQKRSGLRLRSFNLIKFRSMSNATDETGQLLPNHLRLTRFGIFLRSTSLDELPELINIIRGDMSVIGPRPLPCKYDPYYKQSELARFNVRGGLISPDVMAQVPVMPWDQQLACEADYGREPTLNKDIHIFFSVFKTLLKRADNNFGSYERIPLDEERKASPREMSN